jgi:hypothetical protein
MATSVRSKASGRPTSVKAPWVELLFYCLAADQTSTFTLSYGY